MPDENYFEINRFLVDVFNDILRIEEKCLSIGELKFLSMREIHVIEAVCAAQAKSENSRVSSVAEVLGITAGTLTVAINTLVKKGYIERQKNHADKRIVELVPTEKALYANALHEKFHHEMVSSVIDALSKEELDGLSKALAAIHGYFKEKSFSNAFHKNNEPKAVDTKPLPPF